MILRIILPFGAQISYKKLKNQKCTLLLLIVDQNFETLAKKLVIQKSTSSFEIIKFGKKISNGPNLAP